MARSHQKKEYKIMRGVVLWLYNYQCYFSRCKKQAVEVHHLNHNSADNSINNLIPLCANCHKLIHKVQKQRPLKNKFLKALLFSKASKL